MLPRGLSLTPGCGGCRGQTGASFRLGSSQSRFFSSGLWEQSEQEAEEGHCCTGSKLLVQSSSPGAWHCSECCCWKLEAHGNNWLCLGPSSYREDETGALLPVLVLKSFPWFSTSRNCGIKQSCTLNLYFDMMHNSSWFSFSPRSLAHRPGPCGSPRDRTRPGPHALAEPQRPHAHQRHPDWQKDHLPG